MTERERFIKEIKYITSCEEVTDEDIADHLLNRGAIFPPCKVGDTVYKLCTVNSAIKIGQMWDGRTVKNNCDRCSYRDCSCYYIGLRKHEYETMIDVIVSEKIKTLAYLVTIMPYFGTIFFTTEEEAEKALKEMK